MPGDLDQLLAPFAIKGFQGARKLVGQKVNDLGQTENIYEITGDGEWGDSAKREYEARYVEWHQTYHHGTRDPRCTICMAEANFEAQRRPHEQFHKQMNRFDPQCRFCQDDRFFGRM